MRRRDENWINIVGRQGSRGGAFGITWITFNRPEVNNACGETTRDELLQCVQRAESDRDVGCVVITGAGDAFGRSISISADALVVGAHREDSHATGAGGDQASNAAGGSGAAYVLVGAGAE